METTPITISTNNNSIWKWLTGISFTAVAAYFGWKYYFDDQLPEVPDENSNDPVNIDSNSEKYGVQLQKFKILTVDSWAKKILAEAKALSKTFEVHLNDVAVGKYVREGTPDDNKLLQQFENKIREYQIKARQSGQWMESIAEKAQQNNISIDLQLRNSAIWMILTNLIKKYNNLPGGQTNKYDQQADQDNFNGFQGFSSSN